jgi:FKBP-type peptidyl-prolyl cis-trans isomerase FkpA
MKKLLLAFFALIIFISFYSCRVKDNACGFELDPSIKAPDSEITKLQDYITTNSITATKHSSGLFYNIVNEGIGNAPGQCSQVGITYIGALTNGTEFDRSNTNVFYQLGVFIYGWRVGMPLIKKGGKIKLYVPPALGYGQTDIKNSSGAVIIPKNSILVFDINLNEVN